MAAPNLEWIRGDAIEVAIPELGFENSWYPATFVARFLPYKKNLVTYTTLLEEDDVNPVRQLVPMNNVRPAPMTIPVQRYAPGDIVDAYTRDGWWKATVVRMVGQLTEVRFPVVTEDDELFYRPEHVRVHLLYNSQGEWVFKKKKTRRADGVLVW